MARRPRNRLALTIRGVPPLPAVVVISPRPLRCPCLPTPPQLRSRRYPIPPEGWKVAFYAIINPGPAHLAVIIHGPPTKRASRVTAPAIPWLLFRRRLHRCLYRCPIPPTACLT